MYEWRCIDANECRLTQISADLVTPTGPNVLLFPILLYCSLMFTCVVSKDAMSDESSASGICDGCSQPEYHTLSFVVLSRTTAEQRYVALITSAQTNQALQHLSQCSMALEPKEIRIILEAWHIHKGNVQTPDNAPHYVYMLYTRSIDAQYVCRN